MTCHETQSLGAYVLHALEEGEARAVRRHLLACDECLREAVDLASTASLLSLVPPEVAAPPDAPDATGPAPAAPVAPVRHGRRRRALLAAAAVVLVGAGAVPALHSLDGPGPAPQAVELHATGPATGARAAISMVPRDGGTGLHLSLTGGPEHGWCSLVARAADGRREIAATWPATGYHRVDVSGTTTIPAAQLDALSVVTDTGHRLVDVPVPHPNS